MILVLDNYDSFTWNLVQALETAGAKCRVERSDQMHLAAVEAMQPQGIVLSPGPFGPHQTGICSEVVRLWGGRVPILGVCLGMQVIATVAGARVVPSGHPMHGKASSVWHDASGVLQGLPNPFQGARYHSLIVDPASVPDTLEITARTDDGTVMGCRLRGQPTEGVLFHPESFLTEHGARVFENFVHVV
jgi:anthranilate synthase/aminodeoxychorismate synthase-like glutamine amidotransferase